MACSGAQRQNSEPCTEARSSRVQALPLASKSVWVCCGTRGPPLQSLPHLSKRIRRRARTAATASTRARLRALRAATCSGTVVGAAGAQRSEQTGAPSAPDQRDSEQARTASSPEVPRRQSSERGVCSQALCQTRAPESAGDRIVGLLLPLPPHRPPLRGPSPPDGSSSSSESKSNGSSSSSSSPPTHQLSGFLFLVLRPRQFRWIVPLFESHQFARILFQ